MAQSFYTKWQYVFLADAGCYVSREYRNFQTALVREISKYAKAVDAAGGGVGPGRPRHTIVFGRIEQVERKFDKLLCFYRSGLMNIGWGEYRTIDIRYNDQVVCKK